MNDIDQADQESARNTNPIEICYSVDEPTAQEALRILNWFFDQNPDRYLVQKPRTVYDSDGNMKTTVRYQIRQREQPGQQATESNQTGKEQSNESGTIQQ